MKKLRVCKECKVQKTPEQFLTPKATTCTCCKKQRTQAALDTRQRGESAEDLKTCTECGQEKHKYEYHFQWKGDKAMFRGVCTSCEPKRYSRSLENTMLHNAKGRARRNNLPFNLEEADIVIPDYCPILGIKLESQSKQHAGSPTLDKIVPELGYVKGNVQVISHRANLIKSDASIEELEKVIEFLKNI